MFYNIKVGNGRIFVSNFLHLPIKFIMPRLCAAWPCGKNGHCHIYYHAHTSEIYYDSLCIRTSTSKVIIEIPFVSFFVTLTLELEETPWCSRLNTAVFLWPRTDVLVRLIEKLKGILRWISFFAGKTIGFSKINI